MKKVYLLLFLSFVFMVVGLISRAQPRAHLNNTSRVAYQVPTVSAPSPEIKGAETQKSQNANEEAIVKRVVDGDTLELADGRKVRYIGINTPESVDPRRAPQCFGKEASLKNKELVEGKTVTLEKDVSEKDKYGRLLRYVYVGNIFINDFLVREGYAYAATYPPDLRYQQEFQEAQVQARTQNRGLWAGCPTQ